MHTAGVGVHPGVHACLRACVCSNEWTKGEGSPLFNKKCNILLMSSVIKYSVMREYRGREEGVNILVPLNTSLTITTAGVNKTIFPLYSWKISCTVKIESVYSIRDNEISWASCFKGGYWSRLNKAQLLWEDCFNVLLHFGFSEQG